MYPHFRMCEDFVFSPKSTWDTKDKCSRYQKNASLTSSFTQTKDQLPIREEPTESQKHLKLYSITQMQHHNAATNEKQFSHYNDTYNTNPPKRTLSLWDHCESRIPIYILSNITHDHLWSSFHRGTVPMSHPAIQFMLLFSWDVRKKKKKGRKETNIFPL